MDNLRTKEPRINMSEYQENMESGELPICTLFRKMQVNLRSPGQARRRGAGGGGVTLTKYRSHSFLFSDESVLVNKIPSFGILMISCMLIPRLILSCLWSCSRGVFQLVIK